MKLDPIITSLIETDLYKLNMWQVFLHQFNKDKVVWAFKCRNPGVKFTPEMVAEIRKQIDYYCTLRFTEDELQYLQKNLPWLTEDFIDYLRHWSPRRDEILINEGNVQAYNDCGLAIECRGFQVNVSQYEIPILAIVNEVYFAFTYGVGAKDIEFQKRTIEKFSKIFVEDVYDKLIDEEMRNGSHYAAMCSDDPADADSLPSEIYCRSHPYNIGTWSEFGLRRRYSKKMQDWLINFIVDQKIPGFVGTSNVYLAKKYGVKSVGTCAHEVGMCRITDPQYNPAYVNSRIMEAWIKEFGLDNGIYLTDVIGRKPFLLDFTKKYATLFNGVRHDSGDPIEWGEDIIAHYKKLGIDPLTKTLLFSDALDFERATKIKKHFADRGKVAFGIGTWLSNDCDVPALNIVMKVKECNGFPTCKLTDNPEKAMGDPEFIRYVQRSVDWRIKHEYQ